MAGSSLLQPPKSRMCLIAIALLAAGIAGDALAQEDKKLGTLSFPTSCRSAVQADFERGVAMIHSYWFIIARRTFESVLRQDPGCAMAHWGVAMDYLGNILGAPPSRADAAAAWAALERARVIGTRTRREADWIEALSAYYRNHENTPVNIRLGAYNAAMEQMARRYPDDYEAQVFYALTLQGSASKTDLTYVNQLKSAAILEKLYAGNPQHPGVSHFLIHAYDFTPLAEKGIAAADRYAGVAPPVPHARHMPSHIYSLLGHWEKSIASNASAIAIQPDYFHAADFSVYAHLQLAEDIKARALIDKMLGTADTGERIIAFGVFMARNCMPARFVLERADWRGAAALPLKPSRYPQADSLIRFARGLGMARSGNVADAKLEIEAMKELHAALERSNDSYWADRTEEQILAVSAWVALQEGASDRPLQLMRAAADNEDGSLKHIAMENRLFPLRELLGDLLLESKQPAAALVEYQTALKGTPNRFRGILGVARSANAAGDLTKAAAYYGSLIELAKNADSDRQEIREAKAFLASK